MPEGPHPGQIEATPGTVSNGTRTLTPRRQRKLTSSEMLITSRGQEEAVLSVEDWAEIRRLRKSEGMAIKVLADMPGSRMRTKLSQLEEASTGHAIDADIAAFDGQIEAHLALSTHRDLPRSSLPAPRPPPWQEERPSSLSVAPSS